MKGNKKFKEWLLPIGLCVCALVLLFAAYRVFLSEESGGSFTAQEARLCSVLKSIDGVGRVKITINEEGEETFVVVVCDGANDYLVLSDVVRAVSAATGAKKENIVVYKMAKG